MTLAQAIDWTFIALRIAGEIFSSPITLALILLFGLGQIVGALRRQADATEAIYRRLRVRDIYEGNIVDDSEREVISIQRAEEIGAEAKLERLNAARIRQQGRG